MPGRKPETIEETTRRRWGFEDTAIIKGECSTTGMMGTCRKIGWHIACFANRGTLFPRDAML